MARLATFWSGPISPLEIACLLSFAESGHDVTIFSFDQLELPPQIIVRKADEIVNSTYVHRFRTDGRPNIAHFADYFRLLLSRSDDQIWIDSDVFCLDFKHSATDGDIIIDEGQRKVINCVLYIRDPDLLEEAIRLTEAMLDRDLPWAATQNIITRAMKTSNYKGHMSASATYCPVHFGDWYKLLLPEHFEECSSLCLDSQSVHIFNNILQKVGFLKSALPPSGSYMSYLLENRGYTSLFDGIYPADTVRSLVDGWNLRFSGEAIGLGSLVRQAFPSLRRTIAFRRFR